MLQQDYIKEVYCDGFLGGFHFRSESVHENIEPNHLLSFKIASSTMDQVLNVLIRAHKAKSSLAVGIPNSLIKHDSSQNDSDIGLLLPNVQLITETLVLEAKSNPNNFSVLASIFTLAYDLMKMELDNKSTFEVNVIELMNTIKQQPFSRRYYLLLLLSFTFIQNPTPKDVDHLINWCENMLCNVDQLAPSDLTLLAFVTFDIGSKAKLEPLIQDSFLFANFANSIDPVGAELLMISIGSMLETNFTVYSWPYSYRLIEFVCRRLATCNLSSEKYLCKYWDLAMVNLKRDQRDQILAPTNEYTENLKSALDDSKSSNFYVELPIY